MPSSPCVSPFQTVNITNFQGPACAGNGRPESLAIGTCIGGHVIYTCGPVVSEHTDSTPIR